MKLLDEILREHYFPEQKAALSQLLERHELLGVIERSSELLSAQLKQAVDSQSQLPLIAIGSISSTFLTSVNNKVIHIADAQEKRTVQIEISKLAVRILLSIIKLFPDDVNEIVHAIKTTLQNTSFIEGYNFDDLEELVLKELFETVGGDRQALEVNIRTKDTLPFLQWVSEKSVQFLSHELRQKGWIKDRKAFESFFENQDSSLKVHWDFRKKAELAILFYRLNEEKFITSNGVNRGHFSIPERYFVDFSGKPFKKDALKKLSSKINKHLDQNASKIREVNEVLGKLK